MTRPVFRRRRRSSLGVQFENKVFQCTLKGYPFVRYSLVDVVSVLTSVFRVPFFEAAITFLRNVRGSHCYLTWLWLNRNSFSKVEGVL